MNVKSILFFFFIMLKSPVLWAQIKVQKVETTIEKEFAVNSKTNIVIGANKADIKLIRAVGDKIRVKVILSSKNKDRKAAELDVLLQKFSSYTRGNTIYLTNHVELNKEEQKPTSDLHVYYLIEIPILFQGEVKIKNEFGKVDLLQSKLNAQIETRFCITTLLECVGFFRIQSDFGEVHLSNIEGDVSLTSTRSGIEIKELNGDLTCKSSFSKLDFVNLNPKSIVEIDDNHSEIVMKQECLECTHFKFDLIKSEVTLPKDSKPSYLINEAKKVEGTMFSEHLSKVISIKSQSGIFTLQHQTK